MQREKRRAIIAGNWKMNKSPREAQQLIEELKPLVADAQCDVVLCVPFVSLFAAMEAAKGSNIKIGAQNCHWEKSGAFTGEISAQMLSECGVEYVIVGHSERRQYFGETDVTVNKRMRAAISEGLNVIVCVGETLEQRELSITDEILSQQIKVAFMDVTEEQLPQVTIAYEPVWAIGTGKTATSDQANLACAHIRDIMAELFGWEVADEVRVQYGGSMNAGNAAQLLDEPDINGGLIGGASLKAEDFSKIIEAAI